MIRQTEIIVHAPAKVNLILRILERQSNGYHALWSLMQTVGLHDELRLQFFSQRSDITLRCSGDNLSTGPDNLICRAARLVLEQSGIRGGVEVDLMKRIPVAAGLGGGSSDAAATIRGLNQLLGLEWSRETMAALGARLGSDVPFFFSAPSAVVSGWGQQITAMKPSDTRWMVLINPGFPIETKKAFQRLAETRKDVCPVSSTLRNLQASHMWSWETIIPLLENDFEPVVFSDSSVLRRLKTELLERGAEGALLSGSGATVFGIFHNQSSAIQAKDAMTQIPGCTAFAVPTE